MKTQINDYEWHDAMIKRISLHWDSPDGMTMIIMRISWINGTESDIIFENVYKAIMDSYFVENNWIFCAYDDFEEPYLQEECEYLKKIDNNTKYNCYVIETSLGKRSYKIIAQGFRVE